MIIKEYTDLELVLKDMAIYAKHVNGIVYSADDKNFPPRIGWIVIPENEIDVSDSLNQVWFNIKVRNIRKNNAYV